jgi:hypothetical protein
MKNHLPFQFRVPMANIRSAEGSSFGYTKTLHASPDLAFSMFEQVV